MNVDPTWAAMILVNVSDPIKHGYLPKRCERR